jgi:hypothetical protein
MKLFLPTVITAILISISCIAQDLQIPTSVQKAFDHAQPDTEVYWDLENELNEESESFEHLAKSKLLFTGQFKENGSISAHVFNAKGAYIRKEVGIKPSELPILTQNFVRSEIQHPISKAARWEAKDGSIEYCVTLGHRKYLFSQFGNNLGEL